MINFYPCHPHLTSPHLTPSHRISPHPTPTHHPASQSLYYNTVMLINYYTSTVQDLHHLLRSKHSEHPIAIAMYCTVSCVYVGGIGACVYTGCRKVCVVAYVCELSRLHNPFINEMSICTCVARRCKYTLQYVRYLDIYTVYIYIHV